MKPAKPALRVIAGGARQPVDVFAAALPLARELRMMADVIGPASREVADELIELLESPRRPRRIA